jgi:hypothetical protein
VGHGALSVVSPLLKENPRVYDSVYIFTQVVGGPWGKDAKPKEWVSIGAILKLWGSIWWCSVVAALWRV